MDATLKAIAITTPQAKLYNSPAPHPIIAYQAASSEGKGSLPWCLKHFEAGPFPEYGIENEQKCWLTDFATFCSKKSVSISDLQHYCSNKLATKVIKVSVALEIVRFAYLQENKAREEAIWKEQDARIAAAKREDLLRGWPIPKPLASTLPPVEPFDNALFPAPLRPALADLCHRMQCPPDWAATTTLVSIGSLIGARCGIYPKQYDTSWVEVPNLWGAVVAEPSKMKTPTISAAMAPLRKLEKAAETAFGQLMLTHEAESEMLKVRKDALKGQMKAAAKDGEQQVLLSLTTELAAIGTTPLPVLRRYTVNDSTVEKLTELLGTHSRGLLVFRDELAGLLQMWDKPGHENDRAFYLEGWTGTNDYTSDRIGRGTTRVSHCCISLFGGIQPDKIEPYLAQTLRGQNDGMLQRFQLLTWPDTRPYVYVDNAPNAEAQAQTNELFRRIDGLDFTTVGAIMDEGKDIPCFHFSLDAQDYFVQWLSNLERRIRQDDEAPIVIEHLSKYRKLFPALALIFHLVDVTANSIEGPVSLSAVELAAKWCTYLESHARRLYAYRAGAARGAHLLAAKLRSESTTKLFKARDIVRNGWQGLTETRVVEAAIEELVATDWLREAPISPNKGTGRPPAPSYQINPRIYLNT
jgi:hypothetical protein